MVIIIVITGILLLTAVSGFFTKKPEHTYNAEFGKEYEHLSRFNHGFAVTGLKALTLKTSHENCALYGPTGSGKSSVVIISSAVSLARSGASMVFNDVSGEIFATISGYLKSLGYIILRLDFSDSTNSETFNPILFCTSISDIQKVAQLIVINSGTSSKNDPFWEQSSIMLIALFIRYLVFHCELEYRTLQNVLRLIEKFAVDGKTVDRLIINTADEELLVSYKATLVIGEKTLQSVIASTRVALGLFTDPEVCKSTATSSIDFSMLRNEKVVLFVCNPLKDLMYFKPISALFYQSLFNYLLSRLPKKEERSIFVLLDEFATMKFPAISTVVSNVRKHSAGLLICVQDEAALIAQYGQAEAHQIKTNCGCQVFLKGTPLHSAKELSAMFGKHTHIDEKGQERTRELMTVNEIMQTDYALICISNKAPLKCKPVPYYRNFWLRKLKKFEQVQITENSKENPPLIQLVE